MLRQGLAALALPFRPLVISHAPTSRAPHPHRGEVILDPDSSMESSGELWPQEPINGLFVCATSKQLLRGLGILPGGGGDESATNNPILLILPSALRLLEST